MAHLTPTLGSPCDGVLCLDCTKCDRCGYYRRKPEPGAGRHFPHRYVKTPADEPVKAHKPPRKPTRMTANPSRARRAAKGATI